MSTAFADEGPGSLSLGKYDALVDLMQSTPADKLQPILVEKLGSGETDLKQLIAAGALANAETFGGEDYVGFHTAMAMLPALEMTELLPNERQPLPILKVLYRNSQQIQQFGGAVEEDAARTCTRPRKRPSRTSASRFATPAASPMSRRRKSSSRRWRTRRSTTRSTPCSRRCRTTSTCIASCSPIARTAWPTCSGKDYAYTILRQCVRFCCRITSRAGINGQAARVADPRADAQAARSVQARRARRSARAIRAMRRSKSCASTIYKGPPERSAEAAAAALAEGISPEVVGEAISLASNMLVLRQGPGQVADARRFGRRALVRRHQRLAQHGPRGAAAARGQRA